jgi:hypothetical protein
MVLGNETRVVHVVVAEADFAEEGAHRAIEGTGA